MGRLNYAQQTNFIAGIPKLDNIHLYLTNAICPGVNLNLVEAYNQGMKTILAADGISYNSASFNAILDEDFRVYETIINNLQDAKSRTNGSFADTNFDMYVEIHNNKGNLIFTIWYRNCKIESVNDIQLDTNNDQTINTLDFTIRYDWFDISHTGMSEEERVKYNMFPPKKIAD